MKHNIDGKKLKSIVKKLYYTPDEIERLKKKDYSTKISIRRLLESITDGVISTERLEKIRSMTDETIEILDEPKPTTKLWIGIREIKDYLEEKKV